ncbi:unnamed protein product [Oikopleura dioica]|uniref:Uncharacterized protein n=1 Tax=Oikopleura dioica TaxID=34765 RepID=E4YKC7_OIKDI|nr:unnamed protein product [Oikopleura dioica]
MSNNSDTVSNISRDDLNESGYQEVRNSKRRVWVVAGSVTFVVLCTIMAVTLPPALKVEKTTSTAFSSTTTSTDATGTFSTLSTTATISIFSSTAEWPENITTTSKNNDKATFASTVLSSSTFPTTPETDTTTQALLPVTAERTLVQSTAITEIPDTSTTLKPPFMYTTSYETTTVSIVETEAECEFINELLELDICLLDQRYPLKHCNKNNLGS